jgi:hypothetical protein
MPDRLALLLLTPLVALTFPAGALAADATISASPEPTGGTSTGPVNGLYPLWEQTAHLHRAGAFQIGYEHAQVGLGRVQLGTQPILDLHGAFNLQAKAALWRGERLNVALVVGGYHFPTAAEGRTVGNLNASGATNPYAPVWLVPLCMAKSLRLGQRVGLHWASTLLLSTSDAPEHRYVAGGQTVMMEISATPRWSARLHGGAEGWPVETKAHAGISFAYTGQYLYASAGAARRFSFEGESANQVLFDAGLLFP